jgi:hypothetical protein
MTPRAALRHSLSGGTLSVARQSRFRGERLARGAVLMGNLETIKP